MTSPYAADPLFQANPRQVDNLLQHVSDGSLALPDFQRDFTWEPRRTQELLRSVVSRYPAGTLLFWRLGGENAGFASRAIAGAPPLGTKQPTDLILDGQQRITSLYRALTNTGDERFFIRLSALVDPGMLGLRELHEIDFDSAIFWRDHDSKDYALSDSEVWQFAELALPIDRVPNFDEWLDKLIRSRHMATVDEEEVLKRLLRQVRDRFLHPLRSYGFPVVTLPDNTPLEAVCNVFETLNSTGKPLGPFELLTARYYPKGVNLRDLWDQAGEDYPVLGEFGVEPYSLLQAVCLRARNSAQRADVLNKLTADDVATNWPLVAGGFAGVLDWLLNQCGVLAPKWLPYGVLLVPMSAVWHDLSSLKPLERGQALARLSRFFWCSVFASSYDQGANSQAGADYLRLTKWVFNEGSEAPASVKDFLLAESSLRAATTRRKALYAGLIALSAMSGAKDFHTAQKLTPSRMRSDQIDSHHVFPKAFLGNSKLSPELILNRALIDRQTNQIIGGKAPSKYLKDIRAAYTEPKVSEVLASHLIDGADKGPLGQNDYQGFLDSRAERLIELIEDVTGAGVTRDVSRKR